MTMPQMPRPETTTAATVALNQALSAATANRKEAQENLERTRGQVHDLEEAVRTHDNAVRDLQAALDRLRSTS